MVIFRRQGAFRYDFDNGKKGILRIISENGVHIESGGENITLLDLSPNGMRIKCDLDMPIQSTQYEFEVTFILNDKEISLVGIPMRKKQVGPHSYSYGLKGTNSDVIRKEITEEIKIYVRQCRGNR